MKRNSELQELLDLVPSQYVELQEVIQRLGDALSMKRKEALRALDMFGLARLRPVTILDPPSITTIDDCRSENLVNVISHVLGGLPFSALSEASQSLSARCEFLWTKPVLVQWCRKRKIPVPRDWDDWMRTTYPELRKRGLVEEAPTPDGKREAQKRETTLLYQAWRQAAQGLRQRHPDKSENWIAIQVSKLDIGPRRSPETIRKNIRTKKTWAKRFSPKRPARTR